MGREVRRFIGRFVLLTVSQEILSVIHQSGAPPFEVLHTCAVVSFNGHTFGFCIQLYRAQRTTVRPLAQLYRSNIVSSKPSTL